MKRFTLRLSGKALLRIAALATAGAALSACTYDMGLGYASDGYGNYGCDPYSPFDSYYDCDYGYGFSNIGYGGGWYNDYWYPGYGFYLFDHQGRRFSMRDNDRRYWGERRHHWYRENRERHQDGSRQQRRRSGYNDSGTVAPTGRQERDIGRVRDGGRSQDSDNRGGTDERRTRSRGWQGGADNSVNAVPVPRRGAVVDEGQRRRSGERPAWRGDDGAGGAVQAPRADRPAGRPGGRQNEAGRNYRQTAPASEYSGKSTPQISTPAPAAQPRAPRSEEARPGRGNGPRSGRGEGRPNLETQPN